MHSYTHAHDTSHSSYYLVHPLERRHSLTLILIECVSYDGSIRPVDLAVRLLLEGERMLHPLLIVTIREILACVCTTRLLSGCCCIGRLNTKDILATVIHYKLCEFEQGEEGQ
jgi:hypothetical protein